MDRHINNNMKEGAEGRIMLHDVTPETCARFVKWMYKGEYEFGSEVDTVDQLLGHARLFILADRFNIDGLREYSHQGLRTGHASLGDDELTHTEFRVR